MIKYELPPGYFTKMMGRLAEYVSDVPYDGIPMGIHPTLIPLFRVICFYDDQPNPDNIGIVCERTGFDSDFPKYQLTDKKTALLGYSGGKDSVAQAIKLMNEGYTVEAFHVRNLNKSYTDECDAATGTCDILGIPIHVAPIKSQGKSKRLENPVKNLLVLAMMLDLGGPRGVATYSLGTQVNRPNGLDDFYTSLDFSDSPDTLFIGSELFRQVPGFNLKVGELGLSNIDIYYTIKTILSHKDGLELMRTARSCMTQYRFREMRKKHNERKFGVELMPGRCGSCWKCCIEYLVMDALHYIEKKEDFIIHCWHFIDKQQLDWHTALVEMLNRARSDSRKLLKTR